MLATVGKPARNAGPEQGIEIALLVTSPVQVSTGAIDHLCTIHLPTALAVLRRGARSA